MARMGSFAGPSEQYGMPLSFVHPADNDFAKARFNPILLDPRWKLTDEQRQELQDDVDKLTDTLRLGRELVGGYDENYKAPKAGRKKKTQRRPQRKRR